MRTLALTTFAAAALFAAAGTASAQMYYSGPGYSVQIGPRYDYDEPRYYRRHHQRYYAEDYGPRERHFRSRGGRCPPHYTVQDGVCKPYRGY